MRPFLATSGCMIDVKGWRITLEGVCYAVFYFTKDKIISSNSFVSDVFPLSPEIEMENDCSCPKACDFD